MEKISTLGNKSTVCIGYNSETKYGGGLNMNGRHFFQNKTFFPTLEVCLFNLPQHGNDMTHTPLHGVPPVPF